MKWIVLAFVVVCATQAFGKRCDKNEECEADQCCVKHFGWGPMAELGGLCQNLQDKEETCSFPTIKGQIPDTYFKSCPCKEGLTCVNTQEFAYKGVVSYHDPRCRESKNY